jgi:bacterioferritin-associated ferredoxin
MVVCDCNRLTAAEIAAAIAAGATRPAEVYAGCGCGAQCGCCCKTILGMLRAAPQRQPDRGQASAAVVTSSATSPA